MTQTGHRVAFFLLLRCTPTRYVVVYRMGAPGDDVQQQSARKGTQIRRSSQGVERLRDSEPLGCGFGPRPDIAWI